MGKKKAAREAGPLTVAESCGVSQAAAACGVPRGTLRHAIELGQVEAEEDAGGEVRVRLASAKAWAEARPAGGHKRGPKVKKVPPAASPAE